MIIKKISFFTIVSLLILEIYFNYYKKEINKIVKNKEVGDILTSDDIDDFDNNDNNDDNNDNIDNDNIVDNNNNDNIVDDNIEDDNNLKDNNIQIENLDNIPKKVEKIIKFKVPNPWTKVTKNENYSRFYIKINNFNEDLFLKWKKLVGILDYDIDTKALIVETKHNYEALSIVNLLISSMNNNITLEEIIQNNLLGISINKAKNNKLVRTKLIELIKENNTIKNMINNMSNNMSNNNINYSVDTNNINYNNYNSNNINYDNFNNNNINMNNINYDNFNNNNINMNNINYDNTNMNNNNNNNNIVAYGGSEFAFI